MFWTLEVLFHDRNHNPSMGNIDIPVRFRVIHFKVKMDLRLEVRQNNRNKRAVKKPHFHADMFIIMSNIKRNKVGFIKVFITC